MSPEQSALVSTTAALAIPLLVLAVSWVAQQRSAFTSEAAARIKMIADERDELRADRDYWKARAIACEGR